MISLRQHAISLVAVFLAQKSLADHVRRAAEGLRQGRLGRACQLLAREPLQEGVETQQCGSPQVQVFGRPQLEEPGGKPLVEAGRQRLGRTRQEGPGGGLQDAEALVATLPTQQPREVFRLGESA